MDNKNMAIGILAVLLVFSMGGTTWMYVEASSATAEAVDYRRDVDYDKKLLDEREQSVSEREAKIESKEAEADTYDKTTRDATDTYSKAEREKIRLAWVNLWESSEIVNKTADKAEIAEKNATSKLENATRLFNEANTSLEMAAENWTAVNNTLQLLHLHNGSLPGNTTNGNATNGSANYTPNLNNACGTMNGGVYWVCGPSFNATLASPGTTPPIGVVGYETQGFSLSCSTNQAGTKILYRLPNGAEKEATLTAASQTMTVEPGFKLSSSVMNTIVECSVT